MTHLFTTITYQEAIQKLNVDYLFSSKIEVEKEIIGEQAILYYKGDLLIENDFSFDGLVIIDGNLEVNKKFETNYYITGDIKWNKGLDIEGRLSYEDEDLEIENEIENNVVIAKKCLGEEHYLYTTIWAGDDEALYSFPKTHVNTPYLFSWFGDFSNFTFESSTIIILMCEDDDYEKLAASTANTIIYWHEFAYLCKEECIYNIDTFGNDAPYFNFNTIDNLLKKGENIFKDGHVTNLITIIQQAEKNYKETEDSKNYFLEIKKAIEICPTFGYAYYKLAAILWSSNDFEQAVQFYDKAAEYCNLRVAYLHEDITFYRSVWAVHQGNYDAAKKMIETISEKVSIKSSSLFKRVLGEIAIYENNLPQAIELLNCGYSIFSGKWLLGLAYYKANNNDKAKEIYTQVLKQYKEKRAHIPYYDEAQDLAFFFADNVHLNWMHLKSEEKVKDQNYWNTFFKNRVLTGKEKSNIIPNEFRTHEMYQWLHHLDTNLIDYQKTEITESFISLLNEEEIILACQNRTIRFESIPEKYLKPEVVLHCSDIMLDRLPVEQRTYEICLKAVNYYSDNIYSVPAAYKDKKMLFAMMGNILYYNQLESMRSKEAILQALDISPSIFYFLNAKDITQELFDIAQSKYKGNKIWEKLVKEHHPDNFKQDLPNPRFMHRIWGCFWTQELAQAFFDYESEDDDEGATVDDVPESLITQNMIMDTLKRKPYYLARVPIKYLTQEHCLFAEINYEYSILDSIPTQFRNEGICLLSVIKEAESFVNVPLHLRTVELCRVALQRTDNLLLTVGAIPLDKLVEVFTLEVNDNDSIVDKAYAYYLIGIGYLFAEKHEDALEYLNKSLQISIKQNDDEKEIAEKEYFIGYTFYKMGENAQAEVFYNKTKSILASHHFPNFKLPYHLTYLPPTYNIEFEAHKAAQQIVTIEEFMSYGFYEPLLEDLMLYKTYLEEAKCIEPLYWSAYYDKCLAIYNNSQQTDKAIALAHEILEKIPQGTYWNYFHKYNNNGLLQEVAHRNAHATLARYYHRNKELDKALYHIDICFTIIDNGVEDEDVWNEYLPLQAIIYKEIAKTSSSASKKLASILKKIKKSGIIEHHFIDKEIFIEKFSEE